MDCHPFVLLVIGFLVAVRGYPNGAPPVKCDSMLPSPRSHGQPVRDVPSPYFVTVDRAQYSSGSSVVVTVNGSMPFKGLLMEARGAKAVTALGSFTKLPVNTKTIDCSGKQKNALTHSNNKERQSVTVTWVAPTQDVGNIHFQATVVYNTTIFWTEIKSVNVVPTGFKNTAAIIHGSIIMYAVAFCVNMFR